MNIIWIDWLSGFLVVGAMVHLAMAHSDTPFPSVFGKGRKANLWHSIILAVVVVDLQFFTYDFTAILSNGLLLGALDMYLLYLVFGRWLHRKLQLNTTAVSSLPARAA